MGILRRIQLFIVRNSSKNIVIFMLLMFITVFVLTLVSTVEGVQNAGASLKKDIQASFRIQGNYIENIQDGIFETYPIDKSIAEMISSYEEIAAYNITQRTEYVAEDLILPSGQLQGELIGNTDTGLSNDFRKNTVTLIKGKCVFEDGKCEAVISKEFAEENELDIDGSFNLKNLDGESSIVFKVIGIYEAGQNDEYNTDNIFTSNEVIWNMYYAGEFEKIHGSVTFFVSDPGAIENIILDIKDNIPIDWNQYVINTDKGNYNKVSYQLQSIEKLSIILTVISVLIAFVILILLLVARTRERVTEIGILLSIGVNKIELIIQFLVEVNILLFFALMVSLPVSYCVIQEIEKMSPLAEISINLRVDRHAIALQFMMQLFIINIANLLSMMSIIKYEPKEIMCKVE
jgi:putative ABC transport system permease protein